MRPDIPSRADPGRPIAWTVPTPGLLTVAQAADAGVRLWLRLWRPLALMTLLLTGAASVIQTLAGADTLAQTLDRIREGRWPPAGTTPLVSAISTAQFFLLTPWLWVSLTRLALGEAAASPVGLGRALSYGLSRLGSSLWIMFAASIAGLGLMLALAILVAPASRADEITGTVVFIVGAVVVSWLLSRLCIFSIHSLVLEDERGFKALGRSWQLTNGLLRTIATLFVIGVLALAGALIGVMAEWAIPGRGSVPDLLRALPGPLASAVIGPLSFCMVSVLYLDRLARTRGRLDAADARGWLERNDPW